MLTFNFYSIFLSKPEEISTISRKKYSTLKSRETIQISSLLILIFTISHKDTLKFYQVELFEYILKK